jgi:hypothetical protein
VYPLVPCKLLAVVADGPDNLSIDTRYSSCVRVGFGGGGGVSSTVPRCMASTHLESDRTDGTRLASNLSAEGSTNVACCRPVTVFAAALATPGWSLACPLPCFLRLSDRTLADYALQLECMVVGSSRGTYRISSGCPSAAVRRAISGLSSQLPGFLRPATDCLCAPASALSRWRESGSIWSIRGALQRVALPRPL